MTRRSGWLQARARAKQKAEKRYAAQLRAREKAQTQAAKDAEIDALQRDFQAGVPQAIVEYCTMILTSSSYPDDFPQAEEPIFLSRRST